MHLEVDDVWDMAVSHLRPPAAAAAARTENSLLPPPPPPPSPTLATARAAFLKQPAMQAILSRANLEDMVVHMERIASTSTSTNDSGKLTPGPCAVVIVKPPETIMLMCVPVAGGEGYVWVMCDSHPRPQLGTSQTCAVDVSRRGRHEKNHGCHVQTF